jgi:hypothetical protein
LHGDLKLDNFLVDLHGHVVVCDFYMCRNLDTDKPMYDSPATIPPPMPYGRGRQSRKSSPLPPTHRHTESEVSDASAAAFPSASMPYAPPELLRPPPRGPSLAQDVWAVGCILYALLTGRLPFVDSYDPRLQMKILKGHWDQPVGLGREWVECLTGCLDTNMDTRWDIKRVRESDAVVGWREVKHRSKSRSRSRMRGGPGQRDQSRGGSDRFGRGRKDSLLSNAPAPHSHTQPMSIRRPESREHLSPYMQPGHASHDSFGLYPPSSELASASASRSRSTGRSRSTSRRPLTYQQDLSTSLDYMNINRGRSTATKGEISSNSPPPSWQYNATKQDALNNSNSNNNSRSRSRDISMTIDPPRTASASTSRSRPRPTQTHVAVPHTAPLLPGLTPATAYFDNTDSPTRSQSRGRARYSDKVANTGFSIPGPGRAGGDSNSPSSSSGKDHSSSPSISRRSSSQNRNSPDRGGWKGALALDIVDEDEAWSEGKQEHHQHEYRGRSASRRGGH